MDLTKRNHYNPCFWTALWNQDYLLAIRRGARPKLPARRHFVYSLCMKPGKTIETVVDNVHFDTNLGLADMTPESMKDFCRRRFPEEYKKVAQYVDENPEALVMDFENILRGVESPHGHEHFLDAAKQGDFGSAEHKGFVSVLLIMQAMRSHEFMQAMLASTESAGIAKWEYFWLLKGAWSDRVVLSRAVSPLAMARWTLYRTERDRFPLCDSPVMIGRDSVMVPLSPRLLAEVDFTVASPEDEWIVREGIPNSKFREFRRRAIQNSFKDIIFSDRDELHRWLELKECQARRRSLNSEAGYADAVREAAMRVTWAVGGFGRVPDDFERWIGPILDASSTTGNPNSV